MRIQHNIAAMNAYRNYNLNTSAVSKNLEKLSSGYKINRAGDDAAGLAISEKMRAQISGLNAAQSNVKDGISLVKTAEGAMQEVQDMLNRMVTLATQSANGTYDNEVDRAALQQEIDQLNSEINRIADSANFNGIKLLDGSLDENGRIATTTTIFSGEKAGTNVFGKPDADKFNGPNTSNNKKLELTGGYLTNGGTQNKGEVDKSDDGVRYHQDAKGAGKTSFTVDLDGINYEADTGTTIKDLVFGLMSGTKAADATTTAPVNNVLFTTKEKGATAADAQVEALKYSVTAKDGKIGSEDVAIAIEKAIKDAGGKVYIEPAGGGKRIEYEVVRDGDKLTFTMTNDGFKDAVTNTNADNADATKAEDRINYFQGNFNFNVAYQTKPAANSTGNDKLVYDFMNGIDDKVLGNVSTCEINEGSVSTGTIYAQAFIRFDQKATASDTDGVNQVSDIFKDGSGLKLGDDYYIFASSDEVYNTKYADNVHVVDIRDLDMLKKAAADDAAAKTAFKDAIAALGDGKSTTAGGKFANTAVGDQAQVDAINDLRTALDRLSVAAKDNEMFDVQVERRGTMLAINERTTYEGNANLTEKNFGLENQIGTFDSATSTTTVEKEAGTALTLQIGDTSEEYNQLKVNIGDIHAKALGVDKVNVATQEGAQAAIDTIKAAINKVSTIRGTLGATQNRLEHTSNNLSVMAENIQDAESSIRDTDIAAEMMAYTKNNILVQSAQAMLAQANQIPQGVLQLLG